MNPWKSSISGFFRNSFELLDRDADERRRNNEVNKYNRPAVIGVIACALLAVLYGAKESLTPPPSIVPELLENPSTYFLVSEGTVSFSETGIKHPIRLPERGLNKIHGFDPKNIWYEFRMEIPAERFVPNRTGLMIPKIWGRSEVYVNGHKSDFGKDIWPILALKDPRNTVRVHVAAENEFKFGIRATYPLVVADIDRLRVLAARVEAQFLLPLRVLVAQLVVGALFIALFLVLPAKPELLTFVAFTLTNVLYGYFQFARDKNEIVLFGSWFGQEWAVLCLDSLRSYLLFRFGLEFFRLTRNRIRQISKTALITGLAFVPSLWFFFSRVSPNSDPWTLVHVLQQAFFFVCTMIVSVWVCGYLFFHLRHHSRAALGLIVFAGLAYTFGSNIRDFWLVQEKITGEFRNHLLTYFVMAGIIAIEYARTEREKHQLARNLPREQREKFYRKVGNLKPSHEGFVLLVDGVGFSSLQERVALEEQGSASDRLNSFLLSRAGTIEGASVLNGTGDGFYFAWEAPYSEDRFLEIARMASRLSSEKLSFDLGSEAWELRFRCALGYGTYFVGVSESAGLARDFSAGKLLTDLARVIGSASGSMGIRILAEGELGAKLVESLVPIQSLEGKHGARFKYGQLDAAGIDAVARKRAAA